MPKDDMLMTDEDPLYNSQTVEDEAMLLCLELSGEGISNDEVAYGLWSVIAYFAEAVEKQEDREGIAVLLNNLADRLRTQPPRQRDPEQMANWAMLRLNHQAQQEGRSQ